MWLKITTLAFLSWHQHTGSVVFPGFGALWRLQRHQGLSLPGACECVCLCWPGHMLLLLQGGAWSRGNPRICVWLWHFAPCTSSWLFVVHYGDYGCSVATFGPNWNRCCFLRPSCHYMYITNIIYICGMFSLQYKCSRVVGQHQQLKREGNEQVEQEKERQGVGHNHPRR